MCHSILVVGLRDIILDTLTQIMQTNNVHIAPVYNLAAAGFLLSQRRFSLILIDIDRYGDKAPAFLRTVKEHAAVPVIALGQTDVPYNWPVEWEVHLLLARTLPPQQIAAYATAMLRPRTEDMDYTCMNLTDGWPMEQGDFFVDRLNGTASICGETVQLATQELTLLVYFLLHPRQILSYREVCTILWAQAGGYGQDEEAVIEALRGKIEPDPAAPIYIQSVPGIGYWFRDRR